MKSWNRPEMLELGVEMTADKKPQIGGNDNGSNGSCQYRCSGDNGKRSICPYYEGSFCKNTSGCVFDPTGGLS